MDVDEQRVSDREGLIGWYILIQSPLHAKSKILSHEASLHGLNAGLLKVESKLGKGGIVVELGTMGQASGPGKDGGDGVGAGLAASLVLAVVASYGAVSSFSLNDVTIGSEENTGHQPKRAITLSNTVALHVTIVILASPHEATLALHAVGNHVVNEAMLVPNASGLVLSLEVFVEDLLEEVLEATVVSLQDCVLGAEIQGPLLLKSVFEATLGKSKDRLVGVVHAHGHPTAWEVEDGIGDVGTAVLRGEGDLQVASTLHHKVSCLVLVSMGMTTNHNRLLPSRHEAGNVLTDDGLAEHSSSENVTNSSVGALPHLLQFELYMSCKMT